MHDTLTVLEQRWTRFARSPRGARALANWQATEPALAGYPTLDALTEGARGQGVDNLDGRDDLHLALLRLAASDNDARCAVLHLLHPAFVRSARLYADTWECEEVASLIVVAALDIIVRYPNGRPRPAASIVRWVRRALWKEAQRVRPNRELIDAGAPIESMDDVPQDPQRPACDELMDLVRLGLRDGVLDKPNARLIVQHRILGIPTAAIAAEQGYPASTIRQRRSRAEAAMGSLARRVA